MLLNEFVFNSEKLLLKICDDTYCYFNIILFLMMSKNGIKSQFTNRFYSSHNFGKFELGLVLCLTTNNLH